MHTKSKFSLCLLNMLKFHPAFSTRPKQLCSHSTNLKDYEFNRVIQQNLALQNVNQALSYIVKSHLDGVVLDQQILIRFLHKVQQLHFDISYQQVAYEIYRQHFKPHPFMLPLVKCFISNQNRQFTSFIDQDYKTLQNICNKQMIPTTFITKPNDIFEGSQKVIQKQNGKAEENQPQRAAKVTKIPKLQFEYKNNEFWSSESSEIKLQDIEITHEAIHKQFVYWAKDDQNDNDSTTDSEYNEPTQYLTKIRIKRIQMEIKREKQVSHQAQRKDRKQ